VTRRSRPPGAGSCARRGVAVPSPGPWPRRARGRFTLASSGTILPKNRSLTSERFDMLRLKPQIFRYVSESGQLAPAKRQPGADCGDGRAVSSDSPPAGRPVETDHPGTTPSDQPTRRLHPRLRPALPARPRPGPGLAPKDQDQDQDQLTRAGGCQAPESSWPVRAGSWRRPHPGREARTSWSRSGCRR
jgi:hypothetical protein